MDESDQAAWHQMEQERERELDEALKRVGAGESTKDDERLLRAATGVEHDDR